MKTSEKKIKIDVEGMSCSNCAAGIKKHLENKGLKDVNVNFSTGEVSCVEIKNRNKEDVSEIIRKLGYKIKSSSKNNKKGLSNV